MTIINPVTFEQTRQYDPEEYDEDAEHIGKSIPFSQSNSNGYGDDDDDDIEIPREVTVIVKQHIPITDDITEVYYTNHSMVHY